MKRLLKGILLVFILMGVGVLGISLWAMNDLSRYQALSPAEQAEETRLAESRAESVRREQLKGTDCEKLNGLACYEMREQRKKLEQAAAEYEKSDLKKAFDDAGVR